MDFFSSMFKSRRGRGSVTPKTVFNSTTDNVAATDAKAAATLKAT